jgi:hypothetical protein
MAMQLNNNDVRAAIGRGTVYFYWTQFHKALAFNAALKIEPNSFEARLWRDTYNQRTTEQAKAEFALGNQRKTRRLPRLALSILQRKGRWRDRRLD